MTDERDDIPGVPTRRERVRQSSHAQLEIDRLAIAVADLRAIEGVVIPSKAELAAKGVIKLLCDRFYQLGRTHMYTEVTRNETEIAQAKQERDECRSALLTLRTKVLRAMRGEITMKELAHEVTR